MKSRVVLDQDVKNPAFTGTNTNNWMQLMAASEANPQSYNSADWRQRLLNKELVDSFGFETTRDFAFSVVRSVDESMRSTDTAMLGRVAQDFSSLHPLSKTSVLLTGHWDRIRFAIDGGLNILPLGVLHTYLRRGQISVSWFLSQVDSFLSATTVRRSSIKKRIRLPRGSKLVTWTPWKVPCDSVAGNFMRVVRNRNPVDRSVAFNGLLYQHYTAPDYESEPEAAPAVPIQKQHADAIKRHKQHQKEIARKIEATKVRKQPRSQNFQPSATYTSYGPVLTRKKKPTALAAAAQKTVRHAERKRNCVLRDEMFSLFSIPPTVSASIESASAAIQSLNPVVFDFSPAAATTLRGLSNSVQSLSNITIDSGPNVAALAASVDPFAWFAGLVSRADIILAGTLGLMVDDPFYKVLKWSVVGTFIIAVSATMLPPVYKVVVSLFKQAAPPGCELSDQANLGLDPKTVCTLITSVAVASKFLTRGGWVKHTSSFANFINASTGTFGATRDLNSLAQLVYGLLNSFVEWVTAFFLKESISLHPNTHKMVSKLLTDINDVHTAHVNRTFNPDSGNLSSLLHFDRRLKEYQTDYMSVPELNYPLGVAAKRLSDLLGFYAHQLTRLKSDRVQPVALCLVGLPATGKSMLSTMLLRQCVNKVYPNTRGMETKDLTFIRSPGSEYDEGFANQPTCEIQDFLSELPTPGRRSDTQFLMDAIDPKPLMLNMPDLQRKGMMFFNSVFMVVTSNQLNLTATQKVLTNPAALDRRLRTYYLEVDPDNEYDSGKPPAERIVILNPDWDQTGATSQYIVSKSNFILYRQTNRTAPWLVWKLRKHHMHTGKTDAEVLTVREVVNLMVREMESNKRIAEDASGDMEYDPTLFDEMFTIDESFEDAHDDQPWFANTVDYIMSICNARLKYVNDAMASLTKYQHLLVAATSAVVAIGVIYTMAAQYLGCNDQPTGFNPAPAPPAQPSRVPKSFMKLWQRTAIDTIMSTSDEAEAFVKWADTPNLGLVRKIQSCQLIVRLEGATSPAFRVLGVGNNDFLINTHCYNSIIQHKPDKIHFYHQRNTIDPTCTIIFEDFVRLNAHCDLEKDVTIMHIPSMTTCDITKFFINEADRRNVSVRDACIDVCIPDNKVTRWETSSIVSSALLTSKSITSDFRTLIRDAFIGHGPSTTPGHCGSIYRLLKPIESRCILGIHSAGGGANSPVVASLITAEYLDSIRQFVRPKNEPLVQDQETFSDDPFVFPCDESSFTQIRLAPKEWSVNQNPKSQWKPSKFSHRVDMTVFGIKPERPAHLRPFLNPEGEWIYPYRNATMRYDRTTLHLDCELLEASSYVALKPLRDVGRGRRYRMLSFKEAVAGIENDEFMKGIPRRTSAGYPLAQQVHAGKKQFFGFGDEYEFTSLECSELEAEVYATLKRAQQGLDSEFIFQAQLKDERRPEAKVVSGATRLILGAPLIHTILMRMLFGDLFSDVMRYNALIHHSLGINVYSEWTALARFITTPFGRNRVMSFDAPACDAQARAQVLQAMFRRYREFYDDEFDTARAVVARNVYNARVIGGLGEGPNKTIYRMWNSVPSGVFGTGVLDGDVVTINQIMCYKKITNLPVNSFWDNVIMKVNGDDHLVATCLDEFNQVAIMAVSARENNFKLTSDIKSDENPPPFRDISEVTYLSRAFREYAPGAFDAPLKLESILNIPLYVPSIDREVEIQRGNLEIILKELSLHDKNTFQKYAAEVQRAMLQAYGLSAESIPSYEVYQEIARSSKNPW